MGFSRQGYWNGLPFSSPGDLPNPGIKPVSPALQTDTLLYEQPGKLQSKRKKKSFFLDYTKCIMKEAFEVLTDFILGVNYYCLIYLRTFKI